MRRALAAAALAALVLTGCGNDETASETPETTAPAAQSPSAEDESPSASAGASTSASASADDDAREAIEIEIEGGDIEPKGMRVKVGAGEEIVFEVESDRAAQLHVHSSPEQVLEVEKGESRLTLVVERAGLVDIEEHDTGLVVVQLEVS